MPHPLFYQFELIQMIRKFFTQEGLLDVLTPPIVLNPGIEPHIHPFQLYSPHQQKKLPYYLHTSPEFHMKELLSQGLEQIFTLSYSFRHEPQSTYHRQQFLMLEWYRAHTRYEKIMDDVENLMKFCVETFSEKNYPLSPVWKKENQPPLHFERLTIQELFQEYLQINILDFLEVDDLRQLIKKNFKEVPLPHENPSQPLLWEDYYFLLFLNLIEPQLTTRPFLLLYEFPHHLSALSTLKKSNPLVCERFEVYVQGIELCNCYNELTDFQQQLERYKQQSQLKKELYGYDLPYPEVLLSALAKGLPPSAGIALGVERLLMSLTGISNPFFSKI